MDRVLVVSNSAAERDSYLWKELLRRHHWLQFVGYRESGSQSEYSWQREFRNRAFTFSGARPWTHSSLWMRGLGHFLRQRNFDLVHFVFEPWSIVPQVHGSGRLFTVHCAENVISSAPLHMRVRRMGIRRVLNRAVGLVTWGETSMGEMLSLSRRHPRASLVCPSSPPSFKGLASIRAQRIESGLRVGMVSRLVREKGADLLLDAAWNLRTTGLQVKIMGSGPEVGNLSSHQAVKSGVARLVGFGSEADVDELVEWSDVMVVPSRVTRSWTEQWGRSAVESMLAGRPTIVSRSGELPYVQRERWLQFDPGDVDQLTTVLVRLQNPEVWARARSASIRQSQRFHVDILAGGLEGFWERALRRR